MALNTLKNLETINGFTVTTMDTLREKFPEKFNESGAMDYVWFEKEIRPNSFIYIRHDKNFLSFTVQDGPIKENGVNGCQVDEIIAVVKKMISGLNDEFPCRENSIVITKLDEALHWLKHRKEDRQERHVEGYSKK